MIETSIQVVLLNLYVCSIYDYVHLCLLLLYLSLDFAWCCLLYLVVYLNIKWLACD